MVDIEELEDRFGIEGELGFTETEGDLISISVFNKYADAEISLYGAHVISFIPHGTFGVLWMSPDSFFEVGKPIRGGIPVCFPWFGPHPSDPEKPLHGFARLMYWDVIETASVATGETLIRLELNSSQETKKYWPYDFCAQLTIVVGRKLEVSLNISNTGESDFSYTAALHSYFNISGIENIEIRGLEGVAYYDGSGDELLKQETPVLEIKKEENRRYINTDADCIIIDPVFNQAVRVSKEGSNVTVVWNPGEETAEKIEDISGDSYQAFVCVETVNAYNDTIHLHQGEKHNTTTRIGLDYSMSDKSLGNARGGFSVI